MAKHKISALIIAIVYVIFLIILSKESAGAVWTIMFNFLFWSLFLIFFAEGLIYYGSAGRPTPSSVTVFFGWMLLLAGFIIGIFEMIHQLHQG